MNMEDFAKCVGLWLAEGDNKTKAEVTFTNNCFELVEFFHNTLKNEGLLERFNPRVYIYSGNNENPKVDLNIIVKYYVDKRATKPYYIYRVAGVDLVKQWYKLVDKIKENENLYKFILQGFFAGEGNIKYSPQANHSRVVRISQGNPNDFIERILNYFEIEFTFKKSNRMYDIYGRRNFEKLSKLNIIDLHPDKRKKFKYLLSEYKSSIIHYPKGWLKKQILNLLEKPYTTKNLSKMFNRSVARIGGILLELKKEKRVTHYWEGRDSYWIKIKGD